MKKERPVAKSKQKENPSGFSGWYEKNRDEHNRKRREKYASDPKYRKKQLKNTKAWRAAEKQKPKPVKVEREGRSISQVAESVGCSVETLRNLEDAGLIPRVTDEGSKAHRRYTRKQVAMIATMLTYRSKFHYKSKGYAKKMEQLRDHLHKNWDK